MKDDETRSCEIGAWMIGNVGAVLGSREGRTRALLAADWRLARRVQGHRVMTLVGKLAREPKEEGCRSR
ncbi:hypothetical protein SAMN05444161_8884 [Rhizobiales bacterium GAS191]|jgi:hypothetical protein|nr:hypothetical protein SAMN05444161_8884 [Rhizobiales bacterium GAS191]